MFEPCDLYYNGRVMLHKVKMTQARARVGSNDGYYREMNHVFKRFNMYFCTGSSTKTITLKMESSNTNNKCLSVCFLILNKMEVGVV